MDLGPLMDPGGSLVDLGPSMELRFIDGPRSIRGPPGPSVDHGPLVDFRGPPMDRGPLMGLGGPSMHYGPRPIKVAVQYRAVDSIRDSCGIETITLMFVV